MFVPRPVHLSAFLIALAVAGCAITGDQQPQTSADGALSRPKTVLVYDFVFSPDIVVVDREFTARMGFNIGDISGGDQLVIKRVNAEIVATVITILHEETGLNARPGIDDDPALKDTALIVIGQLQPADHSTRTKPASVNFTGGVAADITVSRGSEGTKTELLTFTTQAQKGAAYTGPAATAHNAAIKAVIASKNMPTQNLSPDVEAQARGLGRAIAEKINAYAIQQGWVNKADLPERPADTKPAKNRTQKLPVAAAKQGGSTSPSNTISCDAFTKNERGNWYVKGPVTIDLGSVENKTLQNLEITPKFFTIGGVDLYEAVQKKCGGNQRP
jgi:hypothetical protein